MAGLDLDLKAAPEARYVAIGRVGRPHGLQGALHVHLFNEGSDLLERVTEVRLHLPGKTAFLLTIDKVHRRPGGPVVEFAGIVDRVGATVLTHASVEVSEADLPALADDEFYLQDAIGAVVYDAATGDRRGVVSALTVTNCDLLEITLDSGGKALIPVEADAVESLGSESGKVVIRDLEDWRSE